MSSIDKITECFPFPHLPKILGEPCYASISEMHDKLNANAASVHTNLGCGTLGHLWLTLKPEVYATLSVVPFVPPENPGAAPDIPPQSTAAQIASIRYDFDSLHRMFNKYNNVEQALKTQVIEAVEEIYIQSLRNKYVGYANVTTKELLDHLYSSYANITPSTLLENDKKMRDPLDPSQPLDTFFARMEECRELAAAGNTPYTAAQILSTAYQALFSSGAYSDGCKEWRRKPEEEKNWESFKAHFAAEYLDLRENQAHTAGAAYQLQEYQQDTAEALANLATATSNDRQAVANLTVTNKRLTEELAKTNAELISALKKITYLTQTVAALQGKGNQSPADSNKHYCWSCGTNSPHPSYKCENKKLGHKDKATKHNMMGGAITTYKA